MHTWSPDRSASVHGETALFARSHFIHGLSSIALFTFTSAGTAFAGDDGHEPAPESARPVVLVAGLMQDETTVAPLLEALRAQHLDVTLWIPPNSGLDDIKGYARQLGETVDQVRRRTESAKVDLVGHSEGGVTARRYIKDLGDAAPVHTLVSLGSPQQGSEGGFLSEILRFTGCEEWAEACRQMGADSEFMTELNSGDATPGDVRYVTVGTRLDGVVQPVNRAGIPGAKNVIMQDECPLRAVGHFGLFEDAWIHQVVTAVLAGGEPEGDCLATPVGGII